MTSLEVGSLSAPLARKGDRALLRFRELERVVLRWAFPAFDAFLRKAPPSQGRSHKIRG